MYPVCKWRGSCRAEARRALLPGPVTITRQELQQVWQLNVAEVVSNLQYLSSGKYLFIETSSPNLAGFKAQIRTRDVLDPSCSSCNLTFWYHMYGATIKDLRVFLEPTNGMAAKVVWSETGDQGNQWNFATVPLQSSVSYRIIFEGERGSSYNGDIAIDDIKFEYCPKPPTPTPPPPCSPSNIIILSLYCIQFVIVCVLELGPGDCDFERSAASTKQRQVTWSWFSCSSPFS